MACKFLIRGLHILIIMHEHSFNVGVLLIPFFESTSLIFLKNKIFLMFFLNYSHMIEIAGSGLLHKLQRCYFSFGDMKKLP